MTRIENQIAIMQEKLNNYSIFASEMNTLFISDLNSKIIPILKTYKTGVVEPTKNTYITESAFETGVLFFNVVLSVDCTKLSDLQRKNLKTKFKEAGVPINTCILSKTISLLYKK